MNTRSTLRRSFAALVILALAAMSFGAAQDQSAEKPHDPNRTSAPDPHHAVLHGTVAHASASRVAVIHHNHRQTVVTDADGSFQFSLELSSPAYAELELESLGGKRLKLFLSPGKSLSLSLDAALFPNSARFAGEGAVENTGLSLLQTRLAEIDYMPLYFEGNTAAFASAIGAKRRELEQGLVDYVEHHGDLDPTFRRLEEARIACWEALVRMQRTKHRGDGAWEHYATRMGIDRSDSALLGIDYFLTLLYAQNKARARARLTADPVLQAAANPLTESQYAVACETTTNPEIRNALLHRILLVHLADPDWSDGPLGCNALGELMARFERDCTDTDLVADIRRTYRQCLDGRAAPTIQPYRTLGRMVLEAHIFPAAGAVPGEKRPAFLFFHGGGWSIGTPEWGYGDCRHYAERGMVGISVEYRTDCRNGTTPRESVDDAQAALRWVGKHADELGIDPQRIVVAGFSAGGHLAAAVVTLPNVESPHDTPPPNPVAMVLMSAPVDLTEDQWVKGLLSASDLAKLSPLPHVRAGLPPAIVFHGRGDELCPFSATQAFCNAMVNAGNRCELNTFPGGHFREATDWEVIRAKTDDFLVSLGLLSDSAHQPPPTVAH